MSSNPVIQLTAVSKQFRVPHRLPGVRGAVHAVFRPTYDVVSAVNNLTFSIQSGEVVGFLGPNGAGKTTTLKMLVGLLHPSHGNISILGYTPFRRDHSFLKQCGLVMGQKTQLFWDLPLRDSFDLGRAIYDIPTSQYQRTLAELTSLFHLEMLLNVPPRRLSLGERMKAELVLSILHLPKVLFLDEPTIGLDIVMQHTLREFISQYHRQYNATILLTSHNMQDVERLCPRVILIHHGEKKFDGQLSKLKHSMQDLRLIHATFSRKPSFGRMCRLHSSAEITEQAVTFSLPQQKTVKFMSQLLKEPNVEDVTITDPSLDQILRTMYMQTD